MKYDLHSMLPIRAFKPRSGSRFTSFSSGGMTLEGGGGGDVFSGITDAVSDVVDSVGTAVSDVAQAVSDVGVQVDKSVGQAVPGGWATVGAVVATVATMGAASPLLAAEAGAEGALLATEVATDAAMAAETAGAAESGMAAAEAGASAAVESGATTAVAEGASTSIAADVGTTVAEAGADFVGPSVDLVGGYDAAASAAQQLALQEAAQTAGIGALKGAGMNALSSVVQGRDITPEGLLKGAVTGGVGAGIGNLAGGSLAEYGNTIAKMGGSLAGGLAGGATGAALNGGDIGQGILGGGLSGLAGATSIGAGAGLQEAGLDPTTSRLLTGAAIGAGKSAIAGGDPLMGALGATAGNVAGMGLNAAGNAAYDAAKGAGLSSTGIDNIAAAEQTPEQKLTQLAASNVASDASLSPMEEAIGKVSVTGAPPQTDQEKQYTQQLMEALYPNVAVQGADAAAQAEKEEAVTPQDLNNIDATGNIYDKSGAVVSSAVELGLIKGTDSTGKDVWITPTGDFIPVTVESQTQAQPSDLANQIQTPTTTAGTSSGTFGTGPSESAADNPQQITNNADGSVTILENDGTERTFNVDGSVTITDTNGKTSQEFGPTPAATEPTPQASSSSSLGNLASSLLGPLLGGATSGKSGSGSLLPALAGIGAGVGAGIGAANAPVQSSNPFNIDRYSFDWGSQAANAPTNGVAYGQNFFNPHYTKNAAEGGLMSIGNVPNSVQPTLTNNGLNLDPSNSVQMYAQGGAIDSDTMQIVKHLKSGGAPMHHIAGFLEYRKNKMAQGGHLGSYSDGGRMLKGPGDGMSDDIPATIAGEQPARLANEEFVIPADVVSHLGNGSSEAGAKVLYDMLDKVRKARTGHTKQGKQINPEKLMPKVRK